MSTKIQDKEYKFDKLLTSNDIKYIDRGITKYDEEVECGRCKYKPLKYVNILRIDDNYHNVGDFCYNSIKNILSKIRGKSLYFIKIDLEEGYYKYLEREYDSTIDVTERLLDRQEDMAGIRGRIRELALMYVNIPVAECEGARKEEAQEILDEIESLKGKIRKY